MKNIITSEEKQQLKMTSTSTLFTKAELCEYGEQARQSYQKLPGNCYEICHTLGNLLIDNGLPYKNTEPYTVLEVRIGDTGQENHFVLELDGKYVSGCTSETVTIDPSLDQFCETNKKKDIVDVSLGEKDSLNSVYITEGCAEDIERYISVKEYISQF